MRYIVLLSQKSKSYKEAYLAKIILPHEIEEKANALKAEGKTIATLNGSFDLLHAGHLEIIYQASLQADALIVALNTDRSIKEYKSPSKPIISLEYRAQMMCALEMVSYVTWFDETDPRQLLKKITPHVHVNGAEYGENCIEAEVVKEGGGRIHIVSLVPGLSTSEIIKKICNTCA
jgi:rfaE bifunctional protein nucleotidyltransferase chain/domain